VNAMLGADGDNPLPIGTAGSGKFLNATGKKRLESGRTCLNEHSTWRVSSDDVCDFARAASVRLAACQTWNEAGL
jgi:hypothetical protein